MPGDFFNQEYSVIFLVLFNISFNSFYGCACLLIMKATWVKRTYPKHV